MSMLCFYWYLLVFWRDLSRFVEGEQRNFWPGQNADFVGFVCFYLPPSAGKMDASRHLRGRFWHHLVCLRHR